MDLQPVVLSGGSGTRLWPLSREHFPKQLLALNGELSMLQDTVRRLDGLKLAGNHGVASPLVVCNEEHRFLVAEQVRRLGITPTALLLEPFGRNTAPALTLAAITIAAENRDAIMLVMPADHVIRDNAAFQNAVRIGFAAALDDYLVTFGIVPTGPETGYGYLRKGAAQQMGGANVFVLDQFVEKPDLARAKQYVESGQFLWNSGIFMMKASTWLKALKQLQPQMEQACRDAFDHGSVDKDFFRVDAARFKACPSDSIDYAVMEKITGAGASADFRALMIPLDAGWSDVGAFPALWEIGAQDGDGNVLKGDVIAHKTRNTFVHSEYRLVATVGLDDMVVVETADAVLVAHKDCAQDIKEIVARLKADKSRTQHQTHRRVYRPWGTYEGIDVGDRFQVKRITVNPGAALSLQMHHHRAEHWIVVRGTARVTRGDDIVLVSENQSTYIPLGVKHRLENPGKVPLELIEVQSGSYLGEDDIVRFEDVYGRHGEADKKG